MGLSKHKCRTTPLAGGLLALFACGDPSAGELDDELGDSAQDVAGTEGENEVANLSQELGYGFLPHHQVRRVRGLQTGCTVDVQHGNYQGTAYAHVRMVDGANCGVCNAVPTVIAGDFTRREGGLATCSNDWEYAHYPNQYIFASSYRLWNQSSNRFDTIVFNAL